ncbi:MAG: quercetin dioxygenase-like cupin family protein [Alphaproteobacteria bacterium]|jgi:quercetin dioxygenase-like cupin family protein
MQSKKTQHRPSTAAQINARWVKYVDLIPCKNAFIDSRSPGSDTKENFTIIGPGVSENPDQHIHISIPHGFNIGGARQPNGCLNSQHSHLTEEVFVAHSGTWAFRAGETGLDAEIIMQEGDIISLPTGIFRGFENVGDDIAYLYAILGQDNPGRVTWAPQVFDMAQKYGLILLENGALVDTSIGQKVPANILAMPKTSPEQVAAHKIVNNADMQKLVIKQEDFVWQNDSSLAHNSGVQEAALIGCESPLEGLKASKINWPHDFTIRALRFAPKSKVPMHTRSEEEVIFVQSGQLTVEIDGIELVLEKGDTVSTPIFANRCFVNLSEKSTLVYITRRHNIPQPPTFI